MTFIKLRIYKFLILNSLPEYHAEIEAYRKAFSYSEEGLDISTVTNKDGIDGYELIQTYSLGFSGLSEKRFMERYFPRMVGEYTIDRYALFSHNCRHFALDLIRTLRPSRPENGLYVLGELNKMSEKLGRIGDLITRNIVRIMTVNPVLLLTGLFKILTYFQQGRILDSAEITKDYLLIAFGIMTTIIWSMTNQL